MKDEINSYSVIWDLPDEPMHSSRFDTLADAEEAAAILRVYGVKKVIVTPVRAMQHNVTTDEIVDKKEFDAMTFNEALHKTNELLNEGNMDVVKLMI